MDWNGQVVTGVGHILVTVTVTKRGREMIYLYPIWLVVIFPINIRKTSPYLVGIGWFHIYILEGTKAPKRKGGNKFMPRLGRRF